MLKNFKPISLILLTGVLGFPQEIFAEAFSAKMNVGILQQDGKATGTVSDDFGPVAGASVVVKGSTNGTMTDMDGNFVIPDVKNGDVLQISFIGYVTQEIVWK